MKELDHKLRRRVLVTRAEVLEAGGTDDMIRSRVRASWWEPLHAGVYRRGPCSGEWMERLEAALLAAGPEALVSHRAAFVLWGLAGLQTRLVEITVPYGSRPVPVGVIRHRTRRQMPSVAVSGLRATTVERTLLDCAALVPFAVLAKGADSAVRLGLTSPFALAETACEQGGRGVRGTSRLFQVIDHLEATGPTDSPAEATALHALRAAGLPIPVLQYEVMTPSGRRYKVDFGWPDLGKGVEIDGMDAHSGPDNLDRDLRRQNDLLEAGIDLRRFTARAVHNDIDGVVAAIARFLAS